MKRYKRKFEEEGLGKKVFYTMDNVGSSKYTVSKHDGKSTNRDGSPFYDIAIFKNKKDLYNYIAKIVKEGYVYDKSPIYK
jgi:hypothetical protein